VGDKAKAATPSNKGTRNKMGDKGGKASGRRTHYPTKVKADAPSKGSKKRDKLGDRTWGDKQVVDRLGAEMGDKAADTLKGNKKRDKLRDKMGDKLEDKGDKASGGRRDHSAEGIKKV
jgi:hypothetical protein